MCMDLTALLSSHGCQPVRNILAAAFGTNGPFGDSIPFNTTDAFFTVSQGGEYVTYKGQLNGNFTNECPGYALVSSTERKGLIPVGGQMSFAIDDIAAISLLRCSAPILF